MSRPSAEGRGAESQIDGDIEYLSSHCPDQLALRLDELIMQSTENTPLGPRVVVLNKALVNAEFREGVLVVTLQKKSSAVGKDSRLQQLHFSQICFVYLH
jgi:hypothetical protein